MAELKIYPEMKELAPYLEETEIVDYSRLAPITPEPANTSDVGTAKALFYYVRDKISHSADINSPVLSWQASEVQAKGHGICFAKSNLLVALLRKYGIPAGFCYQRLILDDETAPYLILHGLTGAYLAGHWIRLDARGNKGSAANAEFSLNKEQLAFPVRKEWGESEFPVIYAAPAPGIQRAFASAGSRCTLWANLPQTLG